MVVVEGFSKVYWRREGCINLLKGYRASQVTLMERVRHKVYQDPLNVPSLDLN